MQRSTIVRVAAVGATCALAGTAAGIAGTSADTPNTPSAPIEHRSLKPGEPPGDFGLALALPGDVAGPPVHSETVVPNKENGFDTIIMDRGTFSSLSGQKLTINEGTKTATYKSVTLTIPSDATVRRNGEKAQLSDIKTGDTVAVVRSAKSTVVDAFDAQHEPQLHVKFRTGDGQGKGDGPSLKVEGSAPAPPEAPEGASTEPGPSS